MAKVRTYTLAWGASPDADVVGYRLRWALPPQTVDYTLPYTDVGNVTQVSLPLGTIPLMDGDITIGLSAIDDVGNESDIAVITSPFDLVAPAAPTNLRIL
jgi:hypothetical protein